MQASEKVIVAITYHRNAPKSGFGCTFVEKKNPNLRILHCIESNNETPRDMKFDLVTQKVQ